MGVGCDHAKKVGPEKGVIFNSLPRSFDLKKVSGRPLPFIVSKLSVTLSAAD